MASCSIIALAYCSQTKDILFLEISHLFREQYVKEIRLSGIEKYAILLKIETSCMS